MKKNIGDRVRDIFVILVTMSAFVLFGVLLSSIPSCITISNEVISTGVGSAVIAESGMLDDINIPHEILTILFFLFMIFLCVYVYTDPKGAASFIGELIQIIIVHIITRLIIAIIRGIFNSLTGKDDDDE